MEIEQIKEMMIRALADGRLSRKESENIKAAIHADNKVTAEECQLLRQLQEMVFNGEILLED